MIILRDKTFGETAPELAKPDLADETEKAANEFKARAEQEQSKL